MILPQTGIGAYQFLLCVLYLQAHDYAEAGSEMMHILDFEPRGPHNCVNILFRKMPYLKPSSQCPHLSFLFTDSSLQI